MANLRVASRYVKSLLGLAVEQGVLEEVHNDMLLFSSVCDENKGFTAMLRSPVIRHEHKREILKKLFADRISKLTMSIIDIITRKNREPLLPAIASEFHNAYNAHNKIGKAYLTTTIKPDKDLLQTLEKISKKLLETATVEMHTQVDSDLIGGFILRVGDRQVDASIRTKLRELDLKFSENYFIKKI